MISDISSIVVGLKIILSPSSAPILCVSSDNEPGSMRGMRPSSAFSRYRAARALLRRGRDHSPTGGICPIVSTGVQSFFRGCRAARATRSDGEQKTVCDRDKSTAYVEVIFEIKIRLCHSREGCGIVLYGVRIQRHAKAERVKAGLRSPYNTCA